MIESGARTDDTLGEFAWAVFCDCGYAFWVVMGLLAASAAAVWS